MFHPINSTLLASCVSGHPEAGYEEQAISEFQKFSLSKRSYNCKTFLVKMSFICMRIKIHVHINSFTLSLALKQRLGADSFAWRLKLIRNGEF